VLDHDAIGNKVLPMLARRYFAIRANLDLNRRDTDDETDAFCIRRCRVSGTIWPALKPP